MVEVGNEPGRGDDGVCDEIGLLARQRHGLTAIPTDEMLMPRVLGEVIDRGAMTKMGMGEQAGVLQCLEGSVHRGPVETCAAGLTCSLIDVGRAQVLVMSGRHHLTNRTPRHRDAVSALGEGVDELGCGDVHRNRLSAAIPLTFGRPPVACH